MSGDDVARDIDQAIFAESVEELYEQAPCGYLSTLPDGTLVRANQTLLDWIGSTRESLLGRSRFQTLLTVGSRIYYETHYAPLLQMQGFVNEVALDLQCAEGRVLPVMANARQRRDSGGSPLLNRIMLFDWSDRKRYERELLLSRRKAEQAAKDRADLLAMLSHDIRGPLNAIMGVVQMLSRSRLDESQQRLVRLLTSSSDNMLKLLDHVLDLSRAESSTFALIEAPFSLADLIEDAVSAFRPKARDKHVELRCAVDDRVPALLLGDPIAIRQIVTNLVDNAVKFTHHGRVEVTVQVTELAPAAVTMTFTVSDTGMGIPPDLVERIFDEFTQAGYETAVRFGGSGLGLSITRRLLALYGSTVTVTSAPGEGSTFAFDLRLPTAGAEQDGER
jgi:PAS domain S-box-containing protein